MIPGKANAEGSLTYWELAREKLFVVLDSATGYLSPSQEKDKFIELDRRYNQSIDNREFSFLGDININDFQIYEYQQDDLGTTQYLTYNVIDPLTGLPISEGSSFNIASVRYDAVLNPFTLNKGEIDETSITNNLITIGVSSDANSSFKIPFTLEGFEPVILATPLDENGNQILNSFNNLNGIADAAVYLATDHSFNSQATPEPLTILGAGTAIVFGTAFKRKLAKAKKK